MSVTKRPFSVGYFSSYDRGLECLLDMWPKIKEQVPEATLDIYYGWDMFKQMHAKNPEKMRWLWLMMKKMNQDGVKEHGRVSHVELAKAMKEITVHAYPTEFTEIHMITALKTAEAGMHQVHTGVGALMETAPNATIVKCDDIYTNAEKQTEFVQAVVDSLNNPQPSKQIDKPYWTDVAEQWDKALA